MMRRLLRPLCVAVIVGMPLAAGAQDDAPGQGLLAREPETPQEQFDAALTMLKLARPQLARQYLDALLASNPDGAVLFAIRDKHGTATFVQLSRIEALQPASVTLLDMLNAAAKNQLDDPVFQDKLAQELTSPSLRERESSLDTLRALGDDAAPLIIRRLASGATADEEVFLMQALLKMGRQSAPPLTAALESPNDHVRNIAADLLGRLDASSAVLPLKVVAFDPGTPAGLSATARRALARLEFGDPLRANQVSPLRLVDQLRDRGLKCFRQEIEFPIDEGGTTPLWTWNDAAGTVQKVSVSPKSAALQMGEASLRSSLRLSPDDGDAQALLLGHLLWRDVLSTGWDQPLPAGPGSARDLALTLPTELVQQTLELSLENGNPAAALQALSVLAQTGSRSRLLAEGSPLLKALDAAEPRVQFAAAETIMQLDPQRPFPGAGRVVEIFARALHSTAQPKTVVIDPNTRRGAALAGLVSTLGFDSGLASTGQEGFQMATGHGNVELALLHLNTVRWELSQTIANLRADPRTRNLPIAVYGPPELRGATRRKLEPYQLVSYLDDAGDAGLMREQLTPLISRREIPELTAAQRAEEVASAAYWLRHIADGQRTNLFPLDTAEAALSEAIGHTAAARDALIALGSLGKPGVQQRMAEAALTDSYSVETRRAAIVQLAFHIQRYGRMLDNASANKVAAAYQQATDPQLKSAWAAVIGALGPNQDSAGSALRDFPVSPPLP